LASQHRHCSLERAGLISVFPDSFIILTVRIALQYQGGEIRLAHLSDPPAFFFHEQLSSVMAKILGQMSRLEGQHAWRSAELSITVFVNVVEDKPGHGGTSSSGGAYRWESRREALD